MPRWRNRQTQRLQVPCTEGSSPSLGTIKYVKIPADPREPVVVITEAEMRAEHMLVLLSMVRRPGGWG